MKTTLHQRIADNQPITLPRGLVEELLSKLDLALIQLPNLDDAHAREMLADDLGQVLRRARAIVLPILKQAE